MKRASAVAFLLNLTAAGVHAGFAAADLGVSPINTAIAVICFGGAMAIVILSARVRQ